MWIRSRTWSGRAASFGYAFRGLAILLRSQPNAWVHAGATAAVCLLGWRLGLTRIEWAGITLAIAGVWIAEAFNTALEFLADAVHPERHPLIAQAKDVAAAGVLVAAAAAVVVGAVIFLPRLVFP